MMTPRIGIPEEAILGLTILATITQENMDALAHSLEQTSPCSNSMSLSRQLTKINPSLKLFTTKAVLDVIVGLYGILDDVVSVDLLLEALGESIDETENLSELSEPQKKTLKERLRQLLTHGGTLGLVSKAAAVSGDHEKSLNSSRILTDLRPLFIDDPASAPVGFSIMHTLKLVFQKDFETKEFFVVLNSSELMALDKCVQRAKEKENSLLKLMAETSLQVIN